MDYLSNRLVGESKFPDGSFFFGYDYWSYDETEDLFRSVTDGEPMPEQLLRRFQER